MTTTDTFAPALLGDQPGMLIGADWVRTPTTRPVENPATGRVFAGAPEGTVEHVDAAMAAAADAQRRWARRSHPERAEVLAAVVGEIDRYAEELARIVVAEQGKTITEARGEVEGVKAFFDFAASHHKYRPVGELIAPTRPGETLAVREEPLGVIAAITPWNYPAAIVARKLGPALIAGNAVVLKPSETTPLSALAVARLCQLAGVPDGLVNIVTGPGRLIGNALVTHPRTSMVTVTGSTRAGREILTAAAPSIIPVSLELGGKAPFLVFADADLDLAVEHAVQARFWNCGQVCTCNERTYVHRSRYDEFVARFVERAQAIRVGDPTDETAEMGPKVSAAERDKVAEIVHRAQEQGAEVVLGGGRPTGDRFEDGHWFAPTVLAGATNDMDVVQQEVFGPVLPIVPFDDYAQAIDYANSTVYGLTSYVFTGNLDTAMRATADLQFGEVYVNKIGPEDVQGFHHGWKQSGLGGEDGEHGYQRYIQHKTVYLSYRAGS
ncbi:aldehyde dehydrogenase family protein [Pseudonocardia nigra]|uniref:aldehyde dehydrogenase family protein n=1 Tax=Pseudonocardia nigra TaxID=1921578 RepID=UPI001C5F2C58|nr:aldehyde dehydrogenase family protein [Pseudonocardia nigra]